MSLRDPSGHSRLRIVRGLPYPYPRHALGLARSSAILWVLVRLGIVVVAGARTPSALAGVMTPSAVVAAIVVVLTGILVWVDDRRLRTHPFHSNLCTSPIWSVGIGIAVAGSLEVMLQLVLRSVG